MIEIGFTPVLARESRGKEILRDLRCHIREQTLFLVEAP